jgi:MFS family permease
MSTEASDHLGDEPTFDQELLLWLGAEPPGVRAKLNFSGKARIRAIGPYAIALSTGAVAGQILGGALISANIAGSHWRAIFLINLPIGAAVIAAARRYLPADGHRTAQRIDLTGVATLSAALLLLVLPLALGRSESWPVWTWVSFGASAPAFVLFLAAERRITANGGSPLVNVQILARPAIGWGLLTLVAATGTYYALLFTLAQYLQQGLADSPLVSGLTLVPWVAAFGLAGQLVRRLPPRMIPHAPGAGRALLTACYVAISAGMFTGRHSEALLVPLLGAGGFGLGIQFSALIAHLTKTVPTEYAPDISDVSTTAIQIGGALGVAAFSTLYLSLNANPGVHHATHAFAITTAAFAAVALLATATAFGSTHQPTPTHRSSAQPTGAATGR